MYKGLQRPLIFRIFKGKYIYHAGGFLVGGMIGGGIVAGTIGNVAGLVVFIATVVGGLAWVTNQQKTKGLYNKKHINGIIILEPACWPAITPQNKKTKNEENKI